MDGLINSFFLVFVSEMGDKTQLLALLLMLKYKRPFIILAGIFVATVLNHAFASWAGEIAAQNIPEIYLKWILAFTFFIFAAWILIPDKKEEINKESRFGPFITTLVLFFVAEMGDKTQLATVALGAKYLNGFIVTIGSTLGMIASNALAIFMGEKFLKKVPMKWVRVGACGSFILFGIAILIGY